MLRMGDGHEGLIAAPMGVMKVDWAEPLAE
jgi:hypothetical protein